MIQKNQTLLPIFFRNRIFRIEYLMFGLWELHKLGTSGLFLFSFRTNVPALHSTPDYPCLPKEHDRCFDLLPSGLFQIPVQTHCISEPSIRRCVQMIMASFALFLHNTQISDGKGSSSLQISWLPCIGF